MLQRTLPSHDLVDVSIAFSKGMPDASVGVYRSDSSMLKKSRTSWGFGVRMGSEGKPTEAALLRDALGMMTSSQSATSMLAALSVMMGSMVEAEQEEEAELCSGWVELVEGSGEEPSRLLCSSESDQSMVMKGKSGNWSSPEGRSAEAWSREGGP